MAVYQSGLIIINGLMCWFKPCMTLSDLVFVQLKILFLTRLHQCDKNHTSVEFFCHKKTLALIKS